TGKEQRITVTASTQLSKEEVENLVKEAQAKASEDEQKRTLADSRNRAESMAYATEKSLAELGDKVEASVRSQAEQAIQSVRQAMAGSDVQAINQAIGQLETISHQLAQQVYQQTGNEGTQDQGGAGDTTANNGNDDVIDADYHPTDEQ
ncbi:MAG: Hsp70 family protein, partial [Sulfobacillus thermotolerans]|nr:Hsp70 family protein [Sulfobacillus thermotolerans]